MLWGIAPFAAIDIIVCARGRSNFAGTRKLRASGAGTYLLFTKRTDLGTGGRRHNAHMPFSLGDRALMQPFHDSPDQQRPKTAAD